MKTIKAKFKGKCPHCKGDISIGDTIGCVTPNEYHQKKGNRFKYIWYCLECLKIMQTGENIGYWNGGSFLTSKEKDAYNDRASVKKFLKEFKERIDIEKK